MNYKFTDLDRRTYERNSKGHITIETTAKADDSVDLVISDSKGVFIILSMDNRESTAVFLAALACKDKIKTLITV
ncbi:MAG: hypothetical protein GX625_08340 [Clostridiaceae bacterium]|uniref:hypothetical protein n=1 Tax=Syntrophus aciditrophicus TaxID=316277 RepID=UPI0005A21E13|nr:hypothetical protein [Syntrophus aciditrophicus]NLE25336.1 hypothetical protein [Clostridiaceae bacterium]